MVRDPRGQVEHVARLEHPFEARHEPLEDLERQAGHEGVVGLIGNLPAPAPLALQQENIVGINVWADTAARDRVAHHHIIDARMGNEIEAGEEPLGALGKVVRILDQDRPIAAWKLL